MADNYLENRYNEVFGSKKTIKKVGQTLDSMLLKNRSTRGYDPDVIISEDVLKKIINVNTKVASARNQQVLRFKMVTKNTGADIVLENIKLGGALPELHLPFAGTEPNAFIIICSTVKENKFIDMDLGISMQSMLLKAVEIGLNGIIIAAFNKDEISKAFNLKYEPLAVLAIGKSKEVIKLVNINPEDNHNYYRDENNIQYVPKIAVDNLIIND
ncbi:MAG: nitroreductase family protein [Bacteroidales bacterium]|nr:nitroreductase family protein [Bacteroidales bacterium]